MKKYILIATVITMICAMGMVCYMNYGYDKMDLFMTNVEALANSEGESLNCIPDDNSVCVDGDYGVVQPKYYFSQH